MQTIDHRMLGISLVKRLEEQQRVPLGCRLMFIWGSIEPDLNYLTFLKGFLRCSSLKGHSFVNSSRRIKVLLERIDGRYPKALKYYRAGKVIHYLADAFTFPHNEAFTGNIRQHMKYEHMLHGRFTAALARWEGRRRRKMGKKELLDAFDSAHERYIRRRRAEMDDIRYILALANRVFFNIIPDCGS
ncbi:zinc dependent phospholipase C family protein [Gallibacter sp. Marseille-QA0791]|uniref:zinc dependent phospholipase C family protein n=1 Tax=Gallibacter sp. Marseille-QA0791 TaxID=3378781 RepID=UPI002EAF2EC0|nr:zinc dependent phospholipase C family protein [Anaerovoracaceae bacterium]